MKAKTLKEMIEGAYEVAKKLVEEDQEKELVPIFIEMKADGVADILATPFGDDEQKDLLAALLRAKFKADGCTCYIHVSEAWSVCYNRKEEWNGLRPSQSERRREVVIFCGEDIEGKQMMGQAEILRDENNRRSLAPCKVEEMDSLGGRFGTLLSHQDA